MSTEPEVYRGPLQLKVLLALRESPTFGFDLMKKLGIKSPGSIYPELKLLRSRGLIEIKTMVKRKKYYVLSEKGQQQLQTMLLDISRKYYASYLNPYLKPFIQIMGEIVKRIPNPKILSNIDYKAVKEWLDEKDVVYQRFLEEPKGRYNLVITQMIGTMISQGWRKEETTQYLSKIVESLEPESIMVMVEIERIKNIFNEMFFREVLGFDKAPGITETELKELVEGYNLKIIELKKEMGILICSLTKSQS